MSQRSDQKHQFCDGLRRWTRLLTAIACDTCRHDVASDVLPTSRERYYVVLRQGLAFAAIGTAVVVERLNRRPFLSCEATHRRSAFHGLTLLDRGSAYFARMVKVAAEPFIGPLSRDCASVAWVVIKPRLYRCLTFFLIAFAIVAGMFTSAIRVALNPFTVCCVVPFFIPLIQRRMVDSRTRLALASEASLLCALEILSARWKFMAARGAATLHSMMSLS